MVSVQCQHLFLNCWLSPLAGVCVCGAVIECVCVCVILCRSPEECGTVIERIHSCYHPSLAPENRHLLEVCVCVCLFGHVTCAVLPCQRFLDLLVSYCRHLGKEATHNGWQTLNCVAR